MIHPTRMFVRFSKEKFMAAKFRTKVNIIGRVILALVRFALFIPLVLMVVILQLMYKAVDCISDLVTDDPVMRLLYEGLISEPVTVKERYIPDASKFVFGGNQKEQD